MRIATCIVPITTGLAAGSVDRADRLLGRTAKFSENGVDTALLGYLSGVEGPSWLRNWTSRPSSWVNVIPL